MASDLLHSIFQAMVIRRGLYLSLVCFRTLKELFSRQKWDRPTPTTTLKWPIPNLVLKAGTAALQLKVAAMFVEHGEYVRPLLPMIERKEGQ